MKLELDEHYSGVDGYLHSSGKTVEEIADFLAQHFGCAPGIIMLRAIIPGRDRSRQVIALLHHCVEETPSTWGKRWLDDTEGVLALLQKYIDAPDAEDPSRYFLFGVLQELVEAHKEFLKLKSEVGRLRLLHPYDPQ